MGCGPNEWSSVGVVGTLCAAVVGCPRLQGDRAVGSVEGYISLMPNLLILIACSSLLLQRVALLSCCSVCKYAVYCNRTGTARAYRNDVYCQGEKWTYARKQQ